MRESGLPCSDNCTQSFLPRHFFVGMAFAAMIKTTAVKWLVHASCNTLHSEYVVWHPVWPCVVAKYYQAHCMQWANELMGFVCAISRPEMLTCSHKSGMHIARQVLIAANVLESTDALFQLNTDNLLSVRYKALQGVQAKLFDLHHSKPNSWNPMQRKHQPRSGNPNWAQI